MPDILRDCDYKGLVYSAFIFIRNGNRMQNNVRYYKIFILRGGFMLPENIKRFFWECKDAEIDIQRNWFFVIERLLEYGDLGAVKWVLENFEQTQIVEVVKTSRNLSGKTASMWQNYFSLSKGEIRCMNIPCQRTDMIFLPD